MKQIFSSPFFRFYGILWKCARPFLHGNKRLKDGWRERVFKDTWTSEPVDLWLQVASAGEARIAVSLLEEMSRRDVSLRVIVCTWTRQGYDLVKEAIGRIEKDSSLNIMVRFAPLDDPKIAWDAVRLVRPKVLVLVETELWPSLMAACVAENIPLYVINGRMTKSSFKFYKKIASILKKVSPTQIFTISDVDKKRYSTIFPEAEVSVLSNVKFDQASMNMGSNINKSFFCKAERVLLLASIRQKEEVILAPVLQRIFFEYPNIIVIIAPRHMTRVAHWNDRLYTLGMKPILASEHINGQKFIARAKKVKRLRRQVAPQKKVYSEVYRDSEIIPFPAGHSVIWDMFGDLPDLYMLSDAAFVGGSMSPEGGQNFLEALSAGVVPIVGRHLDNFSWALGEEISPSLNESDMIHICENRQSLLNSLVKNLECPLNDSNRQENQEAFQAWLSPRKGSTQKLTDFLINLVTQNK